MIVAVDGETLIRLRIHSKMRSLIWAFAVRSCPEGTFTHGAAYMTIGSPSIVPQGKTSGCIPCLGRTNRHITFSQGNNGVTVFQKIELTFHANSFA